MQLQHVETINIYHWKKVGLKLKTNCKLTLKGVAAQLPPLLVLTYIYFYSAF